MLKSLLKKQFFELFRGVFYNEKKGKLRSVPSVILFIVLYAALIIGVFGSMIGAIAFAICPVFVSLGLNWFYFAFIGLFAVGVGVIGSVFSTYTSLYMAKDNDLLLSMPIPIKHILFSRMLGVYLLGFLFGGVVAIIGTVVYFIMFGITVAKLIGAVVYVFAISIIVLVLSCLLGFLVAKISVRIKNKSYVTALLSVLFFAVYYYVYYQAGNIFKYITENALILGNSIKLKAYPVYIFGNAATGDFFSVLTVLLVSVILLLVTVAVLARSFIKITTTKVGFKKAKVKNISSKEKSVFAAVFGKELRRFTQSSSYMLNCGFGALMMAIVAVAAAIYAKDIRQVLSAIQLNSNYISGILIAVILFMAVMNQITAPSVSLEGNNIWILQSLPVNPLLVLNAKILLHLLISGIPTFLLCLSTIYVIKANIIDSLLLVFIPLGFVLLCALFGLMINLKSPNLNWSNEIIPIKQSLSVTVAIFGGFGYIILLSVLSIFVSPFIGMPLYLLFVFILNTLLTAMIYYWLRTKGTQIFAYL